MVECDKHCASVFYFLLPSSAQLKSTACSEHPIAVAFLKIILLLKEHIDTTSVKMQFQLD